MLELNTLVTKFPPTTAELEKQLKFGTSVGLNTTAKQAQTAVQGALRGRFTIRNRWLEERTPVGIKVRFADRKANWPEMSSAVFTAAKFLPLQDAGGTKIPYKNWLAVPTNNVQPTKSAIIPKALRPANLRNAFVIVTRKGLRLLCVRGVSGTTKAGRATVKARVRGRTAEFLVMYLLLPKVAIKKADVFDDPIRKVVERRLHTNIRDGIEQAFATAKYK